MAEPNKPLLNFHFIFDFIFMCQFSPLFFHFVFRLIFFCILYPSRLDLFSTSLLLSSTCCFLHTNQFDLHPLKKKDSRSIVFHQPSLIVTVFHCRDIICAIKHTFTWLMVERPKLHVFHFIFYCILRQDPCHF